MIKEAIILAGGLGTRLRPVVTDVPKCMAPVAGKPFLVFIIDFLVNQGITSFIYALGFKGDMIKDFINNQYPKLDNRFSFEEEPLGTGGAIKLACKFCIDENILVLNGDTIFKINLEELTSFHTKHDAHCTLCLKPMHDFNRYGVVELNDDNSIKNFKEKKSYVTGLINGGVYALNKNIFLKEKLPDKFSFENDYLQTYFNKGKMYAVIQDKYFIDIGIPEDYQKAQTDFTVIK
ncbi:MAG: nucleotidyltransferase family protein [Ferruginibacter sp.]|nr:nucleotidyltransferase family protein [Bacteroidota bacterium]MBX2919946.1 nucleotidyltransferase family protein [Ferruginibacter sp.]MCC7378759.1 nucleotidyltransferase family protein [Chitinophagaceae bacterium]